MTTDELILSAEAVCRVKLDTAREEMDAIDGADEWLWRMCGAKISVLVGEEHGLHEAWQLACGPKFLERWHAIQAQASREACARLAQGATA